MDERKFWGNKRFVEECLKNNGITTRFQVYTIGKGHKGVYFRTFGVKYSTFIKKFGSFFEDKNCKIYITLNSKYPDISPMYVSVKKL